MTRRAMMFAMAAAPLTAADAAQQVWDVLGEMASALAAGDAPGFLRAFDPEMPGLEDLRASVRGLLAEVTVESSIEPVENRGDDRNRTLTVDWSMHLVSQSSVHELTRREAKVTLRLERRSGKWRVVGLEPQGFFRAPSAGVHLAH